jgi:hypothetical protein
VSVNVELNSLTPIFAELLGITLMMLVVVLVLLLLEPAAARLDSPGIDIGARRTDFFFLKIFSFLPRDSNQEESQLWLLN